MNCRIAVCGAVLVWTAASVPAQTFKVEKFDIQGDSGTDYIAAETGSGRVFVSRGTRIMVVDGANRNVL